MMAWKSIAEALLNLLRLKEVAVEDPLVLTLGINLIHYLEEQAIVSITEHAIKVNNPLGLAIEAMRLGADVEAISKLLSWRDFEKMCAQALLAHGFTVWVNFRFKFNGKRHEVDLLALKGCLSRSLAVCIDCKHWKMRRQSSKLKEAAIKHLDKSLKLLQLIPKLKNISLNLKGEVTVIPTIVTLLDLGFKIPLNGVFVLPVFKLNSFLLELEPHIS